MGEFLPLKSLEVYILARQLSVYAWKIYDKLDWKQRKIIGDQMITAADSVGANIAEGYGRYHYLDKIRFYYNARGSYYEFIHWIELMSERKIASGEDCENILRFSKDFIVRFNNFISSAYLAKNKDK